MVLQYKLKLIVDISSGNYLEIEIKSLVEVNFRKVVRFHVINNSNGELINNLNIYYIAQNEAWHFNVTYLKKMGWYDKENSLVREESNLLLAITFS